MASICIALYKLALDKCLQTSQHLSWKFPQPASNQLQGGFKCSTIYLFTVYFTLLTASCHMYRNPSVASGVSRVSMTSLQVCLNFSLPVIVFMYEKEIYKKHFSVIVLEFAGVLFVCLCVHLAQQHPALVAKYATPLSIQFGSLHIQRTISQITI